MPATASPARIRTFLRRLTAMPEPGDLASVVRISPAGAAVSSSNALVFTVSHFAFGGGPVILIWFAATLLINLWTFRRSRQARVRPGGRVSRRAARMLVASSILLAAPWAVLVAVALPWGSGFDRLIALVVCTGMIAGGTMMLQRTLLASTAFIGTINLGILAGCILSGAPETAVLVVYAALFACFNVYNAGHAGDTARALDRSVARLSEANAELEAAYAKITSLAYVDTVTGLPNRKAFSDGVTKALTEAATGARRFAILLFDLDNFKNVNDSFGHIAGDELLAETGRRIIRVAGPDALVARLGGDEFAVLVPVEDGRDPARLARALIAAVSEPATLTGRTVRPGTSIGIALAPDHATTATDLLSCADAALGRAKEGGRGRPVMFDEKLGEMLAESNYIAAELKRAIDAEGLEVRYQPKIDLVTGALAGAEALVRWRHPDLGPVPPDRFLPVAQDRAMMQRISDYVFQAVAADIHVWRAEGHAFGRIAVNIHPTDLKAPNHLMQVVRALEARGLGPADISLEITEGCFVGRGTETAPMILDALADRGYHLSLDDFGTGHAALTHLRTLPVREIKVDKAFVAAIGDSVSDRAIVSATLAIARGMDLVSVAEGVQTAAQVALLREMGADYGQGFFWAPALPAAEFAEFAAVRLAPVTAGGGAASGAVDRPGARR
ncbi:EAL domain-containing protein [Rhodobacterales bacterium HKCCE2091]|nr:EAL domain-containing protein [Rhodobacterales bacterium HKCCE2091]